MKVNRFHHVSVNVEGASLDEVVSFYTDVLGLDAKARPDIPGVPGDWFGVGDLELHVVGAAPRGTDIDSRGHHYCVAVEDLDAAIAELEDRGIEFVRAVQGTDTVQVWIADPAGNTIELQQDKEIR